MLKFICLFILSIGASAQAATTYHEVMLRPLAGEVISGGEVNQINIGANYNYTLMTGVQVGAEVEYSSLDPEEGDSVSTMALYGTGTWNYPMERDLKDSFFVKGGLGLVDAGDDDTEFGFMVYGGMRMPLIDKITYSPMVGVRQAGDNDAEFHIVGVNFSLLF